MCSKISTSLYNNNKPNQKNLIECNSGADNDDGGDVAAEGETDRQGSSSSVEGPTPASVAAAKTTTTNNEFGGWSDSDNLSQQKQPEMMLMMTTSKRRERDNILKTTHITKTALLPFPRSHSRADKGQRPLFDDCSAKQDFHFLVFVFAVAEENQEGVGRVREEEPRRLDLPRLR